MKKGLYCGLILFMLFTVWGQAEGFVGIQTQLLVPVDDAFSSMYGNSVWMPEIRAGWFLSPSFFIWGGGAWFNREGQTPLLKADSRTRQSMLLLGAGYELALGKRAHLDLMTGANYIFLREETFGQEIRDEALGLTLGCQLGFLLGHSFQANLTLQHCFSGVDIEGESFRLWGTTLGAGLEFRF